MGADFPIRRATGVCLLRLIGLLVPLADRAPWFARHVSNLDSLWILARRGELAGATFAYLVWCYRGACAQALRIRCTGFNPRRWARGPASLLAWAAAALLFLAMATHGFAVTRSLIAAFGHLSERPSQEKLVAYLFPVVFGLSASLILALSRISFRGRRYWQVLFFFSKTLALMAIVVLLWVEGGAALRRAIPFETLRHIAGGILFAIAFVGALGWTVLWSIADQNHRCSVCLRRLVAPVRMGSWASVFEPATIEWLCEDGHGALCEPGTETGPQLHWIDLDPLPLTTASLSR